VTFIRRRIDLSFILGQGVFGESGQDTVKITGQRVYCTVMSNLGPRQGTATIRVYGLTRSLLNQLSSLSRVTEAQRKNRVIIEAGDDKAGMSVVFDGQIMLSQIDMASFPDVALSVEALGGALEMLKVMEPISYPVSADAAVILSDLAYKMGMDFENGGVTGPVRVMLATPYYPGALMEQAEACARDANITMVITHGERGRSLMVITPKGVPRGGLIPLVSPETGLVGYPSYASGLSGLSVKCVFNPQLRMGGLVKVSSDLQVANGQWTVFNIAHELESEVPGGQWFTHFDGQVYGD
jgi:hypothetical protein